MLALWSVWLSFWTAAWAGRTASRRSAAIRFTQRARARKGAYRVEQLRLEIILDLPPEVPIPLPPDVRADVVARMAEALVAVHQGQGEQDDERSRQHA
jgi:hypothetical protein